MSKRTKLFLIIGALLVAALMAGCSAAATESAEPTSGVAPTEAVAVEEPTAVPEVEEPAEPEVEEAPVAESELVVPYMEEWAASPHNDAESEAFRHWDEEEGQLIPENCATCHSSTGYVDFLGGDGSEAGVVNAPAAIGTTVNCEACHNQAATNLSAVTFPSGVELTGLGDEARCLVCHQGRASKTQVDAQIERFGAEDLDAVVEPITEGEREVAFSFINIHYYAAAASLYGSEVHGGYEYDGQTYDAKFDHVPGYDTCIGCHDSHTLEVKMDQCAFCHEGVASSDDLKAIRMLSSAVDYDGDGDVEEGMFYEIEGLQATLMSAIQAYAADVAGTGIVYDVAAHPYWFADADGDGAVDTNDEGSVRFNSWTPRLLKAAYNYQVSLKDPGNYAHGNKYHVQLLQDSINDLNAAEGMTSPVDTAAMARDDAGHFAGNTEAFRHWDAEGGQVPAACARCHSAYGMPQFVAEGANISVPASNGFLCYTCHNEAEWPALFAFNDVVFPSGARVSFGEGDPNNMCLQCHQGRESTVSVNRAINNSGLADDDAGEPGTLGFRNVHYFAGGATLFGTEVQGIYEYEGKTYSGRFMHVQGFDTCTACHDAHVLEPKVDACAGCHNGAAPEDIRQTLTEDYDGDGDVEEGIKGEVDTMIEKLYAALQAAATESGAGIVYDSHAYPYFFLDADGDGVGDTNDEGRGVGYNAWTPRFLRAAYNFQYAQKDPGAYVHNPTYVMQALYDSIEDLGGDLTGMVRPEPVSVPAE